MRLVLAIACSALLAAPAAAAPFAEAFGTDQGYAFIDLATLHRNGDVVSGTAYSVPRDSRNLQGDYQRAQSEWDCAKGRQRLTKNEWLNGAGKVTSSRDEVGNWMTFAPGTGAGDMLEIACGRLMKYRQWGSFAEAMQRGRTWLAANPSKELKLVSKPKWERFPTAKEIDRAYPFKARAKGQGGYALIQCVGHLDHTLSDCTPQVDEPAGAGFAAAAIQLTQLMRIAPPVVDGKPVDGIRVRVPMNFVAPPTGKKPIAGPSDEIAAEAQR